MITMIAWVIAAISTAAFLILWFWVVRRELSTKKDTVESARSQLTVCRKKHMQVRDGPEEDDAKSVLSRSLDIYCQAAMLYTQALQKPWNRIPGFLMGYRKINEGKT